ncbi:family 5 carbohydrate esterase, partial [Cryphonectria parasitica EP155]
CPGMAVLFARGTGEPGNVGLYTGPSFFTALRNYVNGSTSVAFQGIPYPASIPGFLAGGSPFGSAVMATLANKTAAACPNTKLVMSGYSQGAQVVHNAMTLLSNGTLAGYTNTTTTTTTTTATAVDSRVASVVLFGDPLNGTAVSGVQSGRVLSLCNAQDDICAQHGDVVTLDHLTYSQNAAQAAMFVMQKSALG